MCTTKAEAKTKNHGGEGSLCKLFVIKSDHEAQAATDGNRDKVRWGSSRVTHVGEVAESNSSHQDADFKQGQQVCLLLLSVAKLLVKKERHPEHDSIGDKLDAEKAKAPEQDTLRLQGFAKTDSLPCYEVFVTVCVL